LEFLKKPIVILSVFIGFKVFQVCLSFLQGEELDYMPWARLGGVVFLLIASFFAVKRNRVALWVMGIYLLFNIATVFGGLFLIPLQQYLLKSVAVILGSYFVFGGYVLIRKAREQVT